MGKYTNIASALPTLPIEGEYQAEISAIKTTISQDLSEVDLAKEIVSIRAEKAAAKEALGVINLRLTAYEQILTDQFEAAGITQVRLESGETISTQIKPYARVADKRAFRQWCVFNGLESSLTLPWTTTNALVADRLVEGLPEPDGIDTYKLSTVVLRRGRV
jgi:hypothetical protein